MVLTTDHTFGGTTTVWFELDGVVTQTQATFVDVDVEGHLVQKYKDNFMSKRLKSESTTWIGALSIAHCKLTYQPLRRHRPPKSDDHTASATLFLCVQASVEQTCLPATKFTKECGYNVKPRDTVSIARGPEFHTKSVVSAVDFIKAQLMLETDGDHSSFTDYNPLSWLRDFADHFYTYNMLFYVSAGSQGGKLVKQLASSHSPDPFCRPNGIVLPGHIAVWCTAKTAGGAQMGQECFIMNACQNYVDLLRDFELGLIHLYPLAYVVQIKCLNILENVFITNSCNIDNLVPLDSLYIMYSPCIIALIRRLYKLLAWQSLALLNVSPPPSTHDIYIWTNTNKAMAPCFIRDVLLMKEVVTEGSDGSFCRLGHIPCRIVHVTGVVVEIDECE
ncbi:hypothetical protein P692DRAFT_201809141 [Suillus brevipes Sb2]|nr:hypothetical protein P692DRAFT_201809141 [Suillus brevipes Sb2]